MDLPSLASLRAFDSAARHLSFRAAADELSVTQSAVSHQIADLERRLGTALFLRRSRRVELTAVGTLFHPYVRDGLERIEAGTTLVTQSGQSSDLDIQVYVSVAVRWLIPRLHAFTTAHPEIRTRFNTSVYDWEFDESSGDVAIICTAQPNRPSLDYTHLFDARLTPVCSPSLARAGLGMRQPVDLLNHALLHLFTADDEWDQWLRAADVTQVRGTSAPRFDSYLLALEAALDSQGVAIVPTFLAAADLRSGRLIAPFALAIPQARRWYLVCRRERRNDTPIEQLRGWLRSEIAADPEMDGSAVKQPRHSDRP